jgi:hypothetical protein
MRKKVLLFLSFLILSNQYILSQNNFSIGLNLIPEVSFSYFPSYLPSSDGNFGYSIGIVGHYSINSDFFIESGLNYQNINLLFAKNVPNTRNGFVDTNGNGIIDIEEMYNVSRILYENYISEYSAFNLPATINYKITNGNRTDLIGKIGINLSYIYDVKWYSESEEFGKDLIVDKSLQDFSSSIIVGLGIKHSLSQYFYFIGGLKYSFDIFSNVDNYNPRFHTLSLELKLLYNL